MSNSEDQSEYKIISPEPKTLEWLKSKEGLRSLQTAWNTGIYHLKKSNYIDDPFSIKNLKGNTYLVGIKLALIVEEEDLFPLVGEEHGQDGIGHFYLYLLIANQYQSGAYEIITENPKARNLLFEKTWESLSRYDFISKDKNFTTAKGYLSDGSEDESTRDFVWNYSGLLESDLSTKFVLVGGEEFYECLGMNFTEYKNILKSQDLDEGLNATNIRENLFQGAGTSRNEEVLAQYLLSEGFIVSLEPSIYFPQTEVEHRREPDLIVFHQGRVIVIEIDDRAHLKCWKDDPKNGLKKGDANIIKWQRDRDMDRYFLCNGFPVLRVWYEDVRNDPEKVMTEILQVFTTLGGSRMVYK